MCLDTTAFVVYFLLDDRPTAVGEFITMRGDYVSAVSWAIAIHARESS